MFNVLREGALKMNTKCSSIMRLPKFILVQIVIECSIYCFTISLLLNRITAHCLLLVRERHATDLYVYRHNWSLGLSSEPFWITNSPHFAIHAANKYSFVELKRRITSYLKTRAVICLHALRRTEFLYWRSAFCIEFVEIPLFTRNAESSAKQLLPFYFTETLKLPSCKSSVSIDLTQGYPAGRFLKESQSVLRPHGICRNATLVINILCLP
jgi:hypothetical protein